VPKVMEIPSDPGIPTIAAVLDPAELARQLRVLLGWDTSQGLRLSVLRWKANRCTVEIALGAAGGGAGRELIGKVYAEDRSDVYRVMEEIRQAGFGAQDEFAIPQPLAFLPSLRLLLYEKVPGASVRAMIVKSDAADRVRAAEQSARWLARFHARAPRSGPVIHVHDQLMSSERAWRGMADLGEPFADKAGRLLERLSTTARGLGPIEPCAGHGMYTPSQVLLVDGGRRTVTIDWDTYQVADPSHDVARFLVSLKRLGLKCFGSSHALDAAAEVFLGTYVAAGGPADITARLPFQEAVISLERAQTDAEKQKRGWRERAETMLNEALAVLR
jgi:aminoglycoside phosphotransferase (APT) family kinase protein